MRRDEVIERLRREALAIRALGARGMWLYGSTARDEATAQSDVDLFVDYDERFSLIELVRLQNHLRATLGVPVDVTTRDGLHPLIRGDVLREAVRVL